MKKEGSRKKLEKWRKVRVSLKDRTRRREGTKKKGGAERR